MAILGYVRVSTADQNAHNQRLAILEYANKENLTVDQFIEVTKSSRKSTADRRLDEMMDGMKAGDTVVVAELSRLGRSVGQLVILIDAMVKAGIRLICIKEQIHINGKRNIQDKVLLTMFSLLAEIERDLISERTKEGLIRARSEGKLLGRPKGNGKSKLDGREDEIKGYLAKKVNISNLARIFEVSWACMANFIARRGLKV